MLPTFARRALAASAAVALTVTGLSVLGTSSASADTPPQAQAVGNYLDGMVGSTPIQKLVKLADAHAAAPGTTSAQNPLDVTALQKINLPLTGVLQLDQPFQKVTSGVVNQVAVAKPDGYSFGASGAVSNQGGASVGGQSGVPDDTTVNLSENELGGTLPGDFGGLLSGLGVVKLNVGAVAALAQTKAGGATVTPSYNIAGLGLTIGKTGLGNLLQPVISAADSLLSTLTSQLGGSSCSLDGDLGSLDLAGGAVALDTASGGLVIDLQALLNTLGLDLNKLPANTDVIDVVVQYLTSPGGLAKALTSVLHSVVDPLTGCTQGLLGGLVGSVLTAVTGALDNLTGRLTSALGTLQTSSPLAPVGNALKQLIDVGVNVQSGPGAGATNSTYPFTSQLKATPNQSTPVVKDQTLVRAIEINLVGDPLATIAMANAAAGPSTAAPTPSSSSPTSSAPSSSGPSSGAPSTPAGSNPSEAGNGPAGPNGGANANLPTGVPAGMATHGGTPTLPLVLLIVGVVLAGGGALAWKFRGLRLH
jgi:hypothetical protein